MAATPPPQPPPSTPEALPWEQPGYPILEGLYETARLVLVRPSEAFARMSTTGDLGRPLLYAVIFGWLGMIAAQVYNIAFRSAMMSFLPRLPGMPGGRAMGLPVAFNVGFMILAPIFILLGIFIGAAIIHLFLMLVGGAGGGFATTVRVVCYAGTVQIIQVIPFCGGLVALVWGIVIEIIGLAQAHRTTQGKAAVAVLLPLVLCCVCVAALAATFGAAVAGAFRGMH